MKNNNENTTQDKNKTKRIPRIINRSSLAVVINSREIDKVVFKTEQYIGSARDHYCRAGCQNIVTNNVQWGK